MKGQNSRAIYGSRKLTFKIIMKPSYAHTILYDYYIICWGGEGEETKIRKINDCLKAVIVWDLSCEREF